MRKAHKPKTQEEFIAEELKSLAADESVDLRMIDWPYPDMICALPIEAVRRLAIERRGKPKAATSWRDLIEGHQRHRSEAEDMGKKPPDFKTYVLGTLGLSGRSADWFVDEVLRLCEQRPPDACPLVPIVARLIAALDSPSRAPVEDV